MNLQLIDGVFTANEAYEILRDLIEVKIQFHERKINTLVNNVEDVEIHENKIKQLKNELLNVRQQSLITNNFVRLSSNVFVA